MEKMFFPNEIQIFIEEVVKHIKYVLNPEFIILSGSFGKNSWLYSENDLISDFEFVFVCKNNWSLKKKKNLLRFLNNKYQYDISLKGYLKSNVENKVLSNYSRKNPGYISLDFFDSFNQPKILFNKRNEVFDIKLAPDEIPVWEAWRLYVNRMGDLLKLEYFQKIDQYTYDYYWLKIFESTADAFCIVNKIYHKDINERIKAFKQGFVDHNSELTKTCIESYEIVLRALESRSKHDLAVFKIDVDIKKRKKFVNCWMKYFEDKLSSQENLVNDDGKFYLNYIEKVELQKKYLEFNNKFSIKLSNSIRLLYNPILINLDFKFYNQSISWRHVILLSISLIFKEQSMGLNKFNKSKSVLSEILKNGALEKQTNEKFIFKVLEYWKILR